jgi:ubiquinone/menaquinone biosynthesis C-methylase UbiE
VSELPNEYAALRISDVAACERSLAWTAVWLSPDDEVVEFGCGTETSATGLAPSVRQIEAADFSTAMIDIAIEKTRTLRTGNLTFRRADLIAVACPSNGLEQPA